MNLIHLTDLDHPGAAVYCRLTEAQLRHRLDPAQGIFIAESPKVIHVALDAGYQPVSLLCQSRHLTTDGAAVIERLGDVPVYTGEPELLEQLVGYQLTRGVLCAMRRPEGTPALRDVTGEAASLPRMLHDARRIVVIDGVVDSTNVGAIFRSAAALGIDAVLLTPNTCDPLNRRSVRVSMGSVFLVPWTWLSQPLSSLHDYGFQTAAMALTDQSIPLDDARLQAIPRLALVMGTEGDGLPHDVITSADMVVRIPMHHSVDSLNVAAAAAVAFWQLR